MMEVLIGHHKKNPISRTHQTSFRSEDPVEDFMWDTVAVRLSGEVGGRWHVCTVCCIEIIEKFSVHSKSNYEWQVTGKAMRASKQGTINNNKRKKLLKAYLVDAENKNKPRP